jgi:hypothetical protein
MSTPTITDCSKVAQEKNESKHTVGLTRYSTEKSLKVCRLTTAATQIHQNVPVGRHVSTVCVLTQRTWRLLPQAKTLNVADTLRDQKCTAHTVTLMTRKTLPSIKMVNAGVSSASKIGETNLYDNHTDQYFSILYKSDFKGSLSFLLSSHLWRSLIPAQKPNSSCLIDHSAHSFLIGHALHMRRIKG